MRGLRLPIGPANASWSLGAAAALTALVFAVPRRLRLPAAWLIAATGTLLLWGDLIYSRFFGDLTSLAVLPEAGQLPAVTLSIKSLVQFRDALLLINLAGGTVFCLWRGRTRAAGGRAWWPVVVAALVAAIGVARAPRPDFTQTFSHRVVVGAIGPLAYHLHDIVATLDREVPNRAARNAALASTERWLSAHEATRAGTGPAFGAAHGDNLIVLQVESMQAFVLDLTVNGQPLMPNLRALMARGIAVDNAVDQTNEGRTSDAELMSETTLLPAPHGSAVFEYPGNKYEGLARVLGENGYATTSAVAFDPAFWNRRLTHPAFGFTRSLFGSAFAPGPSVGWGLNDRDFLAQMGARLARAPQPFFTWMITLSLHHPYSSFPAALAPIRDNPWAGTSFGNYVEAMKFFDNALGAFVDSLNRAGLLDHTVLAIYGDHDAGFGWDPSLASEVGVGAQNAVSWTLTDRIPMVILAPPSQVPPRRLTAPAGLADLTPTLLALLGIDPASLPYVGRNLLGTPGNAPVVRRYGQWVDAAHLYLPEPVGEAAAGCYDVTTDARADPSACAAGTAEAEAQTAAAQALLVYDLQRQLTDEMNR